MVGKEGPQSVSDGTAGVQNINKEFLFSSEDVPLIIHDSNGMDVKGKERVDEIKAFIDKHQKSGDFTERIHVAWYVISAIDPRCVDDGDVMKMISECKIPLLLIMTHNDYHDKIKVTDAVLNQLLQSAYPEEKEREGVKKEMVKVSNDGVSVGAENELVINESKRDTEGLKLVAKRTMQLMDKKLRFTWISAQVVDTEGKLDVSAGIIAGYARTALLTSLPRIIPLADPLKLAIIFCRVVVIMCQIWAVPPELNKALKETLMYKEAPSSVLLRVGQDLVYTAALALSVVTVGFALHTVKAVRGLPVTVLVKGFSLKVLGTILYVRSAQAGSSKQRWKPGVSKAEYLELCREFVDNADYQERLLNFAKKQHSTMDTAVRKKRVQRMMKAQIVEMYRSLLLHRPNSLFSKMSKDDDVNIGIHNDTTSRASAKSQEQRDQVPQNIETLNNTTSLSMNQFDAEHNQAFDNIETLKTKTSCTSTTFYQQSGQQVSNNIRTYNDATNLASTQHDLQPDQIFGGIQTLNDTASLGMNEFDAKPNQAFDNISTGQNSEPMYSEGEDDNHIGRDDYDDEEEDDYDEEEDDYDEGEDDNDVLDYME